MDLQEARMLRLNRVHLCPACQVPTVRYACAQCGVQWLRDEGSAPPEQPRERCVVCFTDYVDIERMGNLSEYKEDFIGPKPPHADEDQPEWLLMLCGHRYCAPCFAKSVEMYVRGEGGKRFLVRRHSSLLQCVQCKLSIDDDIVRANVPSPLYESFLRSGLRAALASLGSSVRHCPQPGCEYAIMIEDNGEEPYDPAYPTGILCARPVECKLGSCGKRFCASCASPWDGHQDRTCAEVAAKISPEERSCQVWKMTNARPCPTCSSATEKNSGCNHMTCTRCGSEWCWLCRNAYNSGHNCVSMLSTTNRGRARDQQMHDPESRRERLRQLALATIEEPQLEPDLVMTTTQRVELMRRLQRERLEQAPPAQWHETLAGRQWWETTLQDRHRTPAALNFGELRPDRWDETAPRRSASPPREAELLEYEEVLG